MYFSKHKIFKDVVRVLSRRFFLLQLPYYSWLFVDQRRKKGKKGKKKKVNDIGGKIVKTNWRKTDHYFSCSFWLWIMRVKMCVSYVTRNGKTFHWIQLNRWQHLENDDPKSTIDSPQQFIYLLLKQILKFPHFHKHSTSFSCCF